MSKVKKKWQGLHADRYEREPLELEFAREFQNFCESASGPGRHPDHLDYLLSPDQNLGNIQLAGTRDRQVAATVIQWLGSTVGQHWLRGVQAKEAACGD